MNNSELLQRLGAVCPWWKDPLNWQLHDPDIAVLQQGGRLFYEPRPLQNLEPGGLYILRGPRRVGKSVELKRAIYALLQSGISPRRIIHFPCDELNANDLERLVKMARTIATRSADEPRYWFLDEITAVSGKWWTTIKWLRDNDAGFRSDCVVLTGSSMRGLDDAVKALAGRRGDARDSDRLLLPMGFRQFCRATGLRLPDDGLHISASEFRDPASAAAIGELLPWLEDLILAWEAYLSVGGFPRAVSDFLQKSEVQPDFTNALWEVISGEALRRAREFTPAKAQLLLALLASALTQPVNLTSLGRNLGVAPATARERVDDLVATFTAWLCYPATPQGRPDHASPSASHPKCYFTDPLLARLACIRDSDNTACPQVSALSEQQFGLTLLRQMEGLQPGSFPQFASVMYARPTRREVDFVGPSMRGVAFESKYVDDRWRRETATLRVLTDRGVIVTRSVLDLGGEVWAVPVSVAAWLLEPPITKG